MSVVKNGNPNYRPDIDGLRALAVMSVVLFHVNESWLPGGFIGVDIFFVISGFLITGNIANEVSAGTFSLGEFYRRRIRRILPALTTVLLASLLVGQILFLPEDFKDLAYSALLSQLSLANFYFLFSIDTGYFADDSTLLPLLHLWTLGVEEQFYLIWPLALMILGTRAGGRIFLGLLFAVAMASFILAEFIAPSSPMFAYYMLPTRAGQLLAGAILFYALTRVKASLTLPAVVREIISIAALIVIGASLFMLDEHSTFPGLLAIPVTLGAAGLIFVGGTGGATLTRILSWGPIVWIGLISYSLYLWHWPVLAFARYVLGDLTLAQQLAAMALMFVLSAMSFYWVERPFRRTNRPLLTVTTKYFLAPTAIIGLVLAASIATQGYGVWMLNPNYVQQARALENSNIPSTRANHICQGPYLDQTDVTRTACIINGVQEPTSLLWGDSNAGHYVDTIATFAESEGFSFRNIAHSACPPLIQNAPIYASPNTADGCAQSIDATLGVLDRYHSVILAANWERYHNQFGDHFLDDFRTTIETLSENGKDVLVVGRLPQLNHVDPQCEQKRLRFAITPCLEQAETNRSRPDRINTIIQEQTLSSGGRYIDFNDHLCQAGRCSAVIDGVYGYYDPGHLSMLGSQRLGALAVLDEAIVSAFRPIAILSPTDIGETRPVGDVPPGGFSLLEQPTLWRSNRMRLVGDLVIFEDTSEEGFHSNYVNLGPDVLEAMTPNEITVDGAFMVQSENYAVLRVSTTDAGDRIDILLSANSDPVVRRGSPLSFSFSREGDWVRLRFSLPLNDTESGLRLDVVPAAATSATSRYNQALRGSVHFSHLVIAPGRLTTLEAD
ncbi:MAG: acyltransferase family protein [Maricaulis sp.]|uniref:acyltransferase family protein n=1 Tax=Maricaulis sp. TaxID=1486257 RepID=UPI00261EBFAC|nr:acyltransferase family protein [Maricaulis sp.]MDM7984939.1 acyltransferase family protein [Maricaulis sp.]